MSQSGGSSGGIVASIILAGYFKESGGGRVEKPVIIGVGGHARKEMKR